MRYASFFLFAFLISFFSFSQKKGKDFLLVDSVDYENLSPLDKRALDSLLPLYHQAKNDTAKLRILQTIDESLNDESVWPHYNKLIYDEALKHLQDSASLSPKEIKTYKEFYANGLANIAYLAQFSGSNIDKAMELYEKCFKIEMEVGDKMGAASTLNNIALIYNDKGLIGKALENLFRALKIDEETNNKQRMGYSLGSIAGIYLQQGDTVKGFEFLTKSLKLRQETGDKRGMAIAFGNLGNYYRRTHNLEKALDQFKKALSLWTEIGEKRGLTIVNQELGDTYLAKAEIEKEKKVRDSLCSVALKYFEIGLAISEDIKEEYAACQILTSIGNSYFVKGNISKSEEFGLRAIASAQKLNTPNVISDAAKLLAKIYRVQKKWEAALTMHELFIKMRDSTFNQETQKSTFRQQAKYDYEKQQVLKDAEHQKELAVADEEKKRQKIISYSIGAGLFLVFLFSIFILNRWRIVRQQKIVIEQQKKIVDQKNKHITDSINYAKRIQDSILPSGEELIKHFPEHFIFFRPREIVSGDFYWMSAQNGKIVFAVADCTGHGVPGAFMSMIGNTLLNEIVNEQKIFQPAKILDQLNEGIINALHQESRSQDDGMDISVCLFEKNKVTFSGANHSLYIVQNNSIQEIKGDMYSIGSMFGKKNFSFSQKEIPVSENTSAYMTTDGFPDQIGGASRKKFMTKRMTELFASISHLPSNEQELRIKRSFEEWKGENAQLDDVLVAGIKLL